MEEERQYSVLGIHGEDVPSVDKVTKVTKPLLDADGEPILDGAGKPQMQTVEEVEQRNVVRVRMFVGDQYIDEDFNLPRVITIEEQIEDAVKARISEIKVNGAEAPSKVVPEQLEQIVENMPAENLVEEAKR
jgi:hypothetical protein